MTSVCCSTYEVLDLDTKKRQEHVKASKAEDDAKSTAKRKIFGEIKQLEIKKAKLAKDAASAVSGIEDDINELRN